MEEGQILRNLSTRYLLAAVSQSLRAFFPRYSCSCDRRVGEAALADVEKVTSGVA
jgi:hypothetical protein